MFPAYSVKARNSMTVNTRNSILDWT